MKGHSSTHCHHKKTCLLFGHYTLLSNPLMHSVLFLNLESNKTIVEFCFQGVKNGNIGL